MHHIICEIPINLSMLIFEVMQEILNRFKAHLPYGMALTLVFKRFGISFEWEATSRLFHTDTYNRSTLHRMGFTKVDGHWSKGTKEEEDRAEREGPSSLPHECRSPDIQFVSDPKVGPFEAVRRDFTEPQSGCRSDHSPIRLMDDQLVGFQSCSRT